MALPVAFFLFSLFILQLQHHYCTSDKNKPHEDPLNHEEKQALINFYNTTSKNPEKLYWNLSEPACTWKGVTCFTGNKTVMYLQLGGKSLVGEIPPNTIGKLTSLRILSLRVNGFSGQLPPDFSNLTSLTRLSLHVNYFSGIIPPDFSKFKKLVKFSLNNNDFTGQLPFLSSKKLRVFDVSFNKLNTSIPSSLSKFNISLFSDNVFLCGHPTNITCKDPYPDPNSQPLEKKDKNLTGEIVGISIGSGLLFLTLLCHVRRKVYQRSKQPLSISSTMLKLMGDGGFDMEDLLKASAVFLGEGTVGMSYKQVVKENKTVVVKRLKGHVVVTEHEFIKTMEVLKKVKDQNVVPLIDYCYSPDEKWVISDYMPGGSLSARLHGSPRTQLDWSHRMKIALSAAKGLKYLHVTAKVVHGNIKSSNILFQHETNDEYACLSDYGLNMLFAPEVRMTRSVTFESDVYNFGVLLVELLTGKIPKQDEIPKLVESVLRGELKDKIFDVEYLRTDHKIEMAQLLEIAKDCVSSVPDQRPTMEEVLSRMEDMRLGQSSDDHSKGYDYTPSTETQDTPSTITP